MLVRKRLHDVASQILRTIGASYSVSFTSRATGTMEKVRRTIDERFHYSASGFLAEIETRIVSQEFERGSMGVVYRMLVHFPKPLISRMRRLSRGSKVLATRLGGGVYELREVNGVACVLTEAAYVVSERNRHASILELLCDESLKRGDSESTLNRSGSRSFCEIMSQKESI